MYVSIYIHIYISASTVVGIHMALPKVFHVNHLFQFVFLKEFFKIQFFSLI